MDRRDFIKSLSAAGLFLALPAIPAFAIPAPAEWPGKLGRISAIGFGGTAEAHTDSGFGQIRLLRGDRAVLQFKIGTWGGSGSWRCDPGCEIIYTNDMRLEVDPSIIAHTTVHPIDGGMPMYWGAENINGKSVETWIPLRSAA